MNDYPPPLDQLLRLGELELGTEPIDYKALGIGPEHVPVLVRMATDRSLILKADEEGEDDSIAWACEHALLAIGQLGAVEAVEGLLAGIDQIVDVHDFWVESLSDVLRKLGPEALPAVERYIENRDHDPLNRLVPCEGLEKIGLAHPESRDRIVAFCCRILQDEPADDPTVNGFLISALIDLKATEAAPVIEAAFADDRVDPTVAGDWPTVRYELGLGPPPPPRRNPFLASRLGMINPARPDFKKLKKKQKKQSKKRKK